MYTIDKKACADCGYCNYVCPFAAIDHHLDEKYYEINQEKCQQCGQCFDACITSAIHCDADQEKVAEIFINDNCIGCSLCSRNCPVGAITGKIKEKFGTQDRFADALNISRSTLSQKLNNATEFTQTEMLTAMHVLGEDLASVDEFFFNQEVRKTEQ